MLRIRRSAVILFALFPGFLAAQERPAEGDTDGWSLGLSVLSDTNPYIGQEADVLPIPLISYRRGAFEVSTNGVSYELLDRNAWSLTVAARPRFSGLISTDGPLLDGIDRRVTGDLALEARYDIGFAFAGLAFRQEFTGESDGQEVRLNAGVRGRFGALGLRLGAGLAWQNGDLSQYIWGVSSGEARPGRPAYAPGDVLIPNVTAGARYSINDNWSVLATIRSDFFPDAVTDSPIIADSTLIAGGIGLLYRF